LESRDLRLQFGDALHRISIVRRLALVTWRPPLTLWSPGARFTLWSLNAPISLGSRRTWWSRLTCLASETLRGPHTKLIEIDDLSFFLLAGVPDLERGFAGLVAENEGVSGNCDE
jgi:hypothetical protein